MMDRNELQARLIGLEKEMEEIESNPMFDMCEFIKFNPDRLIITDKDKLYVRYYGLGLKYDYYLERLSLIKYIDDKIETYVFIEEQIKRYNDKFNN